MLLHKDEEYEPIVHGLTREEFFFMCMERTQGLTIREFNVCLAYGYGNFN